MPISQYRIFPFDLLTWKSAIEIMGHKDSDPKLIGLVLEQCKEHGFSPFHVRENSIGYIYNR
jgi:hypothetical protein